VSDGEDLSTTELLQRLSLALGKSARLLPVPQNILAGSLKLLGKEALAQRLCGNLQIDMTKTRELLGWSPPVSVDKALQQTAHAYLRQDLSRLK
jgi:nucleoside-diphosphate-sugar epimerase